MEIAQLNHRQLQVDIDDILRRAETRNTEEMEKSSMTDELLSQFKVCLDP